VDGKFKKISEHGIVTFNKRDYFLPAFSSIFSIVRDGKDSKKHHRFFRYEFSACTVETWSRQFLKVYKQNENGVWGVLMFITTLFRDHIHNLTSGFPLLFCHGQPQTGKSKMAESLSSIFFGKKPGFNLMQGTQPGFFRTLAQTRNALVWLEEYRNDLELKRFEAMKGIYDGTGHEKGSMTEEFGTDSTPINSTAVVTSQYFPDRNDGSLATRSILLEFNKKLQDFTTEEIAEYNTLKAWETEGLSELIVEVVAFRDLIEEKFHSVYFGIISKLKTELEGENYVGRVMENFAMLLSVHKLIGEKLKIAISFENAFGLAKLEIIKNSNLLTESDALSSFWKTVEFLSMQRQIVNGTDYKIEEHSHLNVRIGKNSEKLKLDKTTRVLMIQLTRIYPLYKVAYYQQYHEEGFNDTSIVSFMKSSKAFIGNIASTSFSGRKTSAYAFNYDILGITLLGDEVGAPVDSEIEFKPDDLPF
jgi:hypothetical protein